MTDEQKAVLTATADGIKAQIAELKADTKSASEELKSLITAHERRLESVETQLKRADEPTEEKQSPSFGEFLTTDAEFKQACKYGKGKFELDLKGKGLWGYKTAITSTAVGSSTPGILVPQRVPGIIPGAEQLLTIRDILPSRTTSNNAVEFIKENVFTNATSPQVEGSAKAESALTFTIDHELVRTLAAWIPVTRQILQDFDGLRSYIDRKLMYGLKLKEEAEILTGSGVGEHLNGLVTQATAYAGTYNVASDTKLDRLRHAIAEVEMSKYAADVIVLNPVDLQAIELLKNDVGGANTGNYLVGNPRLGGMMSPLWGLRVVPSMTLTAGTFLVGSARMGAEIWDSMAATIEVSDSHAEYFTSNMYAIRCEERLALTVYVPAAWRYGSFA